MPFDTTSVKNLLTAILPLTSVLFLDSICAAFRYASAVARMTEIILYDADKALPPIWGVAPEGV